MKVRLEVLILEKFILVLMKSVQSIDAKFFALDYYKVNENKYGVKCGTSLRYWENKGWISEIDPYGWFQWYFRY